MSAPDTARRAALANGLEIAYETFGDPADPTLLLVMGLGSPMIYWDADFCRGLAARGFHVVRYDNRDCGHSSSMDTQGAVSTATLVKAFLGRNVPGAYGITDLADDAAALLDALGVEAAHVVGVSMGGMIAQTLTLQHPERVLSLASISSTTGNRRVGQQHPALLPRLLVGSGSSREDYIAHMLRMGPRTGSPAHPRPEAERRAFAEACWEYGINRAGTARHMVAVLTQADRTVALGQVTVPTVVIHGSADVMVRPSGGQATASAVPGSSYVVVPGMGHDLPRALWPLIHDALVGNAHGQPV